MSKNKTSTITTDMVKNAHDTHIVTSEKQEPKNVASALSTQMQLLGLAKQFVLDGALIPPEKQMPLEERARKRDRLCNLRKQQNLEAIIEKTINYCSGDEITARADQDWFNSFTVLAEDISNRTMQDLWAKILAGEIAQPGSFSLKSLKVFRNMSINEAKLLAKACSIASKDPSKKNVRIISGAYQTPGFFNMFNKNRDIKINLNQFGLSYAELLALAENELIFIQETESNTLLKIEQLHFNFNGLPITFTPLKNNCVVNFYKFTSIGSELAALIADNPNNDYLSALKNEFSAHFSINN
ncbi:MAG: putative repeat protein (TIGR03899 family) [Alteromonadaceae bacterium]|jgi:uncharacterized repeat protein (TIGR03899 family)